MPISRITLTMDILLKDQETYDILLKKFPRLGLPFSFRQLEENTFGESVIPLQELDKIINHCKQELAQLDRQKPLYGPDEIGTHYANELFFENPPYWGTRGAPFLWAYCARAFSSELLPMKPSMLKMKYFDCYHKLEIPIRGHDYVFAEQFSCAGMSGGMVGGNFGSDSCKILLTRNEEQIQFSL